MDRKCFTRGWRLVGWVTWKTRNKTYFENIHIKNVCEVLFFVIAIMRYWAGLHPQVTQRMINIGINLVMKTVMRLMMRWTDVATILMIRDVADEDEEHREIDPHGGLDGGISRWCSLCDDEQIDLLCVMQVLHLV
jgi:hypothetical protein